MKIKLCDNKEDWNKKFLESEKPEFLQSWEWGEFQISVGNKAVRLDVEGELVQGFEHKLSGLGKYLYAPRLQISDFGLQNLIEYVKDKNYIFLRLEPVNLNSEICNLQLVKNRQPQQTLILDLTQSEEQILAAMHPKTRYNIHLAKRKGVVVKQEKNVDVFWELNKKTIARDKFRSHEKKYYEKMLESPICHQLTAYFENKQVASNIMIIFNNTVTYLHGASADEFRNIMTPHLLQWEGIKLGKRFGCQYYDSWGVAPQNQAGNHPLAGVTRFKAGFGGEYREYPEACDIILRPLKYRLYQLAKRVVN